MASNDPYDIITCPYNMAHQVERYKMHIHLQKCSKQYHENDKAPCPFDCTHIVDDVQMDYHASKCPHRVMLDTQMYVMDDDHRPVVPVTQPPVIQDDGENWDDDNSTSYKPDLAKKPHVYTKVKGATPSERRKARMEGIKNFRPLSSNDQQ